MYIHQQFFQNSKKMVAQANYQQHKCGQKSKISCPKLSCTSSHMNEMNLVCWANNTICFKMTLCMAIVISQPLEFVQCFLSVWCIFTESNKPFMCSNLIMGLPCFDVWKLIATNWIIFSFLFNLTSMNHQLCKRIQTLTSMNPFIPLMLIIIAYIVITCQNSWMKN